ncbi:DEHA2D13288p [Debaryomyces hansenii CBS767]|uniref:DEHA2D13288p n=1 Tax=Debaryomyces hansenii (strain ATCC 36239 / CBS 767 / BCRC 21394 / JCM 1990 / NBRC 0083 / IGC 2968) TaxID=284592 RepID=Q6BRW8_DEBHA|nr:DEHA2D13288p [Debaryomyces hansenii CBS767]CAG87220.2 DEHA2D13288p [Debaryomyces hansenii CBS767]|eukprot:XP_459052.2 DEHA2D13288p [Debaryomyces hansenii CBS767]
MRFGELLNEGSVPEWKSLYLDYKHGKKLIKRLDDIKEGVCGASHSIESDKNSGKKISRNANEITPLIPSKRATNYNQDRTESQLDSPFEGSPNVADNEVDRENFQNNPEQDDNLGPLLCSCSSRSNKNDELEIEKRKFKEWLDSELDKVNSFYREKEESKFEKFVLLQDQLYQLREHKAMVLRERLQHQKNKHKPSIDDPDNIYNNIHDIAYHTKSALVALSRFEFPSLPSTTFLSKWKNEQEKDVNTANGQSIVDINYYENRVRNGIVSADDNEDTDFTPVDSDFNSVTSPLLQVDTARYLTQEPQSSAMRRTAGRRDYSTKKNQFRVPYAYARKQLEDAIIVHYGALSLLKSFRELNRTAFRKLTKKFDLAMHTSISAPYMEKIDNESYFQTSDTLDRLISQIEELYVVFFDNATDRRGSLEKLKSISYVLSSKVQKSFSAPFFSSGVFIGFGLPIFISGLYFALRETLNGDLPEGRFLLQIWGGFFLLILAFLLFGINMYVFDLFKINYKFIFEFNLVSALNYKQFLLLPSFGFAFLSIIIWFSSNDFWPDKLPSRDWPWIFLGVMMVIFIWPGVHFYASSRKWLQVALWRLLLSGFYPVEFRDFFLGDMFCSLVYTMGNIPFFFCLYANKWNGLLDDGNTAQHNVCGSSRSRSMGFFSSLPSIWRFLQCLRRYMDTGDWFPHLANMLKFAVTAIYYGLLSVYRIDNRERNRTAFIIFALINTLYTSSWDIMMDWSLLQSGSKNKFLRDNLFFKRPIYYYCAMVIDVILRFQWIFYAFFTSQIQQSAVTSFCVALAELIRRFIWIFFRVENEHCTNVTLFRASRNSPLPYAISSKVERSIRKLVELKYNNLGSTERLQRSSSIERTHQDDEETEIGFHRIPTAMPISSTGGRTHRKSIGSFSDALNTAHIKDFQRRKTAVDVEDDESDDDEEEERDEEDTIVFESDDLLK